jgi:hypothetical protein
MLTGQAWLNLVTDHQQVRVVEAQFGQLFDVASG